MFKALLKTLPSLSGNMKLSCFVDNYKKHNKTYSCNVKVAKLLPLAHTLFDKNIYVNLKNNSFEYDVKNFYKSYFDVFYKSNYNYSQINIPIIDFTNNLPDTNEDFSFGCKRISYGKYQNQIAFFAPIYIESLNDIKDKYFKITCIFDKVNTIRRELIIRIYDNTDGENYLADYLKRYAEKIDDKVIYMSSTYKNMYYGIDLLHGGFIHIEDNISKNLYKQYYTINDFDAIINFGFKRNSMIMKQIIPLSFYFNPQNLLTSYEKSIYKDAKITIFGEWYTEGNDNSEKFYNFSDNYTFYNESIYQLSNINKFSFLNSTKNIMDMDYPAFKEASSENYKYINTIVKNYNRWKLKYSKDNYPYIINNNFAFSNNQNSLYSYKEFPLIYKTKDAICKFKGENYNMFFDLTDIYDNSGNLLNIKSDYYDYFNKNYITHFYNLLVKKDKTTNSNKDYYENIFSNDEYWASVNKDNKLYYKGVLYDFNILYSQYLDMPKIDKFSIFVNPEMMSSISNWDYNTTYNSVKYTVHNCDALEKIDNERDLSINPIEILSSYVYKYDFIQKNSAYITNGTIVYNDRSCAVQDKNGNYVDLNGYCLNNGKLEYLHYNKDLYVDVEEVLMYANLFMNSTNQTLYDKIYNNYDLNIISGYKVINIKYKNNIISEIYSELLSLYPEKNYQFNNDNLIYSEHRFLENDDIYWAYDKLYFSIYPNKIKYKLLENSQLLYDMPFDQKITIYYQTEFILLDDLKSLYNYNNDSNFNKLNKYYVSNTLYDKVDKQSYSDICFVCLKDIDNHYGKYTLYNFDNQESHDQNDQYILNNFNENVLFIDPYNLNNFYLEYFKEENLDTFKFYKVKDCYCNFLNMEHVHKYFDKLYNDENLSITKDVQNLQDNIYIKIHLLNNVVIDYDNKNNINFINTTTKYIKLINLFNINGTTSINLYKLLDYIGYNENGYFYLTRNYFIDYKKYLKKLPYSIHNFELCFKKTMGIVNTKLYNLIMQLNSHNLFKDLYLYKPYNYTDYKFEYVLNSTKLELSVFEAVNSINSTESLIDKRNKQWNSTKIYDEENLELYPYFNSIYNEEKLQTKIYNDSFLNNIIKSENSDTYKYNVYNLDYLTYFPKNDRNIMDGLCPYRYSLYTKYNNCMVNSYMFINKYMDYKISYVLQTTDISKKKIIDEKIINITDEIPIDNDTYTYSYFLNPNCSYGLSYNKYQDYGKLITYNYNGITYGFYIIHEEFDNTCNTLNLLSDNFNKINVASYINGIESDKIFNNQYTYLTEYYHNLVPYINNSNIVKDFLNNVNTVILPNKYTLTNIYQQMPNNDENSNTTYSYNIILKGKTSLQLLRYFDNISPYIYETNNVTSYYLYYKNTNTFIENDLANKRISYIMYQKSNNIYDEKFVSYFDNTTDINSNLGYLNLKISNFSPVEYKNYNNNKFYNLETSFIIKPKSSNNDNKNLFTKQEIDTLENDADNVYNLFKEHLLDENNMLTENDILFLYKKYDVKFSHNIKSFHKNSNGDRDYDLYTLTIKYNLF